MADINVKEDQAPKYSLTGKHAAETVMTHTYRGSIVVLLISKSVEPNEDQKEMISSFQ